VPLDTGFEIALWVPPLVAFVISFFACMGGVSGAFLLLPFQVSVLGFTAPAVSATNQLFNATSIPAGVYRYWREGRMVWPLTWILVAGTLPGVLLGAVIRVRWLPDPAAFKLFAAVVMAYIGARMVRDLLRSGADTEAERAFHVYRKLKPEKIAEFLDKIADEIVALGDELLERGSAESGLPVARLTAERGRTAGQLKLFAGIIHI